ncbi:hypothetical protein DICPUDRAFT_24970 [Dictyostelium purpureum]|uniref:Uncharacterized protein n=1 Tax=Dictyostelium purpureum TaxID=5786 RepID=F0Z636_DICPU|nr:uncharacterized protein DICPUDRAFT_24970 [Dictyostelium purpureum]EGC40532.1 hypothetical protein DICPUDRAFT_24970 [Dictyostelium purpureum]|eukprot:XP_003282868.1 hypothetical protein DICPUDRAFT_24970 [Dictyostelium purpureum]
MSIYDKNQNTLSEYIKDYLNEAYYKELKKEFQIIEKEIKESEKNYDNISNLIKEILLCIKSPKQLLNINVDVQSNFLYSPDNNHQIFKPIHTNINKVNSLIEEIKRNFNSKSTDYNRTVLLNSIMKKLNSYSEQNKSFINKLTDTVASSKKKSVNILAPSPLWFSEDLKHYEVKSLDLAYDITSYNVLEHQFKKKDKNQAGNSIGSTMDDKVYFKVEHGGRLIMPAREHAIYQFYKKLFPNSKSALVSPTQLILIDNLKILNPESIRELGEYKTKHNETNIEKLLEYEPELRKKVEDTLQNHYHVFLQASLFTKGTRFDKYLESCEKKMKLNGSNCQFDDIDIESFSSHVIASLLVLPTDYKPDNLILEEDSNYIIGIDNDQSLEANEIELISDGADALPNLKNVLYTLKPLMVQPVNESVKNEILKTNQALFILKWLETLYKKQKNYESIISMQIESKGLEVSNEYIEKKKEEINLPLEFKKGWVHLMDKRFKKIKQILQSNQTATHQDLFSQIHPLSSIYYEYLSKVYNDQPIDIISALYKKTNKLSFQDIIKSENSQFNQAQFHELLQNSLILEKSISIYDAIKEYISTIEFSSLSQCIKTDDDLNECGENCKITCKTRNIVIEFLSTICSLFDYTLFHPSWYKEKFNIFSKLLRYGASVDVLNLIIRNLNIIIKNEDYNTIIREKEVLTNPNICNQIEFLIDHYKLDVERVENKSTLLDIVSTHNLPNLFIKLLELGAGKNSNPSVISRYYQNLSNDQKLELKPYLINLFSVNPKINWRIAINQLFPLQNEQTRDSTKLISEITNTTKRIISDEYWDQLFDSHGQLRRSNEYGSRTVTLIQDSFGNGIYLKFKPQFPGTEIAVNKLSEIIFGNGLTPYCELASINDSPVLLIQQVYGEPLVDIFNDSPNIIGQLEPINISKQLILSMLINNADGNLGNFIVSKTLTSKDQRYGYRLVSIDNDQCFMPSVSKSLGTFEKSLQVDTVLFLFNQMNDKVHKDVIDRISKIDVYKELFKWLEALKYNHQSSLDHFSSNRERLKKEKETVIGVSFNRGMISHIFSKLKRLQQLLKENTSVTHIEVLEFIEPLVSNRYRPFLNLDVSLNDRYLKLKNFNTYSKTLVSCSKHPSAQILLSRDIPNVKDIMDQLWSGKYGPSQSLEELNSLDKDVKTLNDLINLLDNKAINLNNKFSTYNIECLLKFDFINIPKEKQKALFNFLANMEISIVTLRNCNYFNQSYLNNLQIDSIVRLDISSCKDLLSIGNVFKSMVKISIKDCSNLTNFRIKAPNLKALTIINCSLKNFISKSPELQFLNLKGSIKSVDINIFELSQSYKNLEYLNISESIYETLHIRSNLKTLDFSSMKFLFEITLEASSGDYFQNINLWKLLNNPNNKQIIEEKKMYINLRNDLPLLLFWSRIASNIKNLYLGHLNYIIPLEHIPPNIKRLELLNGFNQALLPHQLPNTIKHLVIGGIKKPLEIGSISKATTLTLLNGFDKSLRPGFIGESVTNLFIDELKYQLKPNVIPSSVVKLRISDHQIQSDTLPLSVRDAHITLNSKALPPNSIPPSITTLTISINSFNHLNHSLIPNSVKNLYIINNSSNSIPINFVIPDSVILLELRGNFDYIQPGMIPDSIRELYIDKIKIPLKNKSIPYSVTTLEFGNDFNNSLQAGIIPDSVTELYIGKINLPIFKAESIPNSVKILNYSLLSRHIFDLSFIPDSVTDIYVFESPYLIEDNLVGDCVPFNYHPNFYKKREKSYNNKNYYIYD